MAKKERKKGGLTKKHWFGYMFGDWGGCMTFALMASTFTMYCTNALGMYMYSAVYHDLTYQSISSALSSPFMIGSMILVPFLCKKVALENSSAALCSSAAPSAAVFSLCIW